MTQSSVLRAIFTAVILWSPAQAQTVVFLDTFNRPDTTVGATTDSSLTGITSTLFAPIADNLYLSEENTVIESNRLSKISGVSGMGYFAINHPFNDPAIVSSGSFSVSLNVISIVSVSSDPFDRFAGFGVGYTAAEANGLADVNTAPVSPALGGVRKGHTDNGSETATTVGLGDFFVEYALNGNVRIYLNGSRVSDISSGLGGPVLGVLKATFTYTSLADGTTIQYQVFDDDVSVATGSFTASSGGQNYIAFGSRATTDFEVDDLTVTIPAALPGCTLTATPNTVNSGVTSQPVTLNWTATHPPTGGTYEINPGNFTGSASSGTGSVNTTVDGTLGNTVFTINLRDAPSTIIATSSATVSQLVPSITLNASPVQISNAPNQAVTLTWTGTDLPTGSTYMITANKPVSFPNSNATGPTTAGTDTVSALVDGTAGVTTFTISVSGFTPAPTATASVAAKRPNVVMILTDDLGWADLGCYGSFIRTPNLDYLANQGVRFREFYQTARCSASRCAVLTGLYTQQAAVDPGQPLPPLKAHTDSGANNITMPELLLQLGYNTYMAGKWHIGTTTARNPRSRGFQHVFGQGINGNGGNANNAFDYWLRSNYSLVNTVGTPDADFSAVTAKYDENDNVGDGLPRFHYTNATGDYSVDFINHSLNESKPFFLYMAFNAPHWPVQGPAALADRYTDVGDATPDGLTTNGGLDGKDYVHFEDGWDSIRQQIFNRQVSLGIVNSQTLLSPKGDTPIDQWPGNNNPIDWGTTRIGKAIVDWDTLSPAQRNDLARRMACYAASIEQVDQNIGKVTNLLSARGELDNTLIMFCSDNGSNFEGGQFGNSDNSSFTPWATADLGSMAQPQDSKNTSYPRVNVGGAWANVANAPFRMYKHYTAGGGIRTPAIVFYPNGTAPSARDTWTDQRAHIVDLMATVVATSGAPYPGTYAGHPVLPLEGTSLLPVLQGHPLAPTGNRAAGIGIEHEFNLAWFEGDWKLLRKNLNTTDGSDPAFSLQLYNLAADPTELNDLSLQENARVIEMAAAWNGWAARVGVDSQRFIEPVIPRIDPANLGTDLFTDTFNRAAQTDPDASSAGMSGLLVPSPLGSGSTYFDSFETTADTAVYDGGLVLASGPNMTELALRQNFASGPAAPAILAAGGFSVQLRIDKIVGAADTDRWLGYGVGLTQAEALTSGDFANTAPPFSFRGKNLGNGSADFFIELDALSQIKFSKNGSQSSPIPVGQTSGTLLASYAFTSFNAGSTVTVNAWFNGLKLNLGGPGGSTSFVWQNTASNYIGISARASTRAVADNLAIRTLPLGSTLANQYALASGLNGLASGPDMDPDHDGDSNFVEWLKGGDPNTSDANVRLLTLTSASSGDFSFDWIRLNDPDLGVQYTFAFSTDMTSWTTFIPEEITTAPFGTERQTVTARVPPTLLAGQVRLFVRIAVDDD